MRASRLVSLLLLLQTRGGLTAQQLADELEVSLRTVYRDVEALSQSGVPIYAERGPHGGIRLVDGYRTRLTGLTQEEAEGVFLSGLPGPAAQLGLGTVVAAARLKVLAALPPELRARASRVAERFHLDAPGWFQPSEPVPQLETLAAAAWAERTVAIRYDRGDRVVERVIEPLGIVLKAGVWYLMARTDGQLRTYRVARVSEARMTESRFDRPAGFDLAEAWAESIAAYQASLTRIDVTLRAARDRVERITRSFGSLVAEVGVADDPADPSAVLLQLRLESLEDATADLLRFGGGVEVVSPVELRAAVIERARGVLERYGVVA